MSQFKQELMAAIVCIAIVAIVAAWFAIVLTD